MFLPPAAPAAPSEVDGLCQRSKSRCGRSPPWQNHHRTQAICGSSGVGGEAIFWIKTTRFWPFDLWTRVFKISKIFPIYATNPIVANTSPMLQVPYPIWIQVPIYGHDLAGLQTFTRIWVSGDRIRLDCGSNLTMSGMSKRIYLLSVQSTSKSVKSARKQK